MARVIGTYGQTVIIQHGGGDYRYTARCVRAWRTRGQASASQRGERDRNLVGPGDPDLPAHLHFGDAAQRGARGGPARLARPVPEGAPIGGTDGMVARRPHLRSAGGAARSPRPGRPGLTRRRVPHSYQTANRWAEREVADDERA